MRVFVYEWTCCVENAPLSLRREGWEMLRAVLEDFLQAGEIKTVTVVHKRFDQLPPGEVHRIHDAAEEEKVFRALAADADATLVIAPETSGLLVERARWVEEAAGVFLGSASAAIALAADKLRCGQWWRQHGVPTPMIRELRDPAVFPAVLKPRDGAGAQATFLVRDAAEMGLCMKHAEFAGWSGDFVVQDYVTGQAASIAFLIGPRETVPLPPAKQFLSTDGRFRYLGGMLPLPSHLAKRAVALGRRAIEAVPGLRGYVGFDLVLGDAVDGSCDFAIELNPRLTTSYLGLRHLAHDNLALAMLRVALAHDQDTLRWREEEIHFTPDDTLETFCANP